MGELVCRYVCDVLNVYVLMCRSAYGCSVIGRAR